jgi:DNA-binding NtrC family response regulator
MSHWVARCDLARARALLGSGLLDRARTYADRARHRFEVSGDTAVVEEIDSLLRELDSRLASSVHESKGRYGLVTEGYERLETSDIDWDYLHQLARGVALETGAARLLLATTSAEDVTIAMSVDEAGHGTADVTMFLRTLIGSREVARPFVASSPRRDLELPAGAGAVAVLSALARSSDGLAYLLYVDRNDSDGDAPFSQGDVQFLGAAARLLAVTHRTIVRLLDDEAAKAQASFDRIGLMRSCGIVSRSPLMAAVLQDVAKLRDSRIPVLIRGESGVGKELVAQAIHEDGRSCSGAFVALNAGAIAPHLQESELFGHVRGAFTDARQDRAGLVAAADRGTLFLDEVGEMSQELQVKLLRFLQSGEYRRVGENRTRRSDARIVSATNRDLVEEVRAGRFRRDLFYRLCAFIIDVPPLRDRPEDIPILMRHFLDHYAAMEGKRIPGFVREVADLFAQFDWKGNNVRELENEIRRAVVLTEDGHDVTINVVSEALRSSRPTRPRASAHPSLKEELEQLETSRILQALESTGWNKTRAAELLGVSRTGLLTKMKKHGIG